MNPLVKKEIRLLLPAWVVAMLLALVQAITRPYDFYVAALLFLGMTMMTLTTIGRETSLNTFSFMLAQPAERIRHWQTKLSVLAGAFLIIFGVWFLAFGFAFWNSAVDTSDAENSRNLFITVCLIATSTFTGGLWTTLLLRQLAAAFWLTLLVPATLSGFTAAFVSQSQSDNGVIAVICVILGIYSVGGFLFARWLFFRAQDVGWSGGTIALPEWKFLSAHAEAAGEVRKRKPIFALFQKEFQLHQVTLMGAAGLLVLHVGVIVLRGHHKFAKDSAGEILTSIFWMLWLVLPVVIGAMAVAEERRQGVMEGQLCLPVSRRIQFAIKGFLALFLGVFLGGVMPILLETIGVGLGANNPVLPEADTWVSGVVSFELYLVAFVAWLVLVSFFASTLAKSFLQAVGYAVGTVVVCSLLISTLINERTILFHSTPMHSVLTLIIAVPTMTVTLLWLAYLNFKNFRDGWPLWRRNLLGVAGTLAFITISSSTIYNRAWEVFEPAEPPHGPAKLSLSAPPALTSDSYDNLLVRLPDGRVWFDHLSSPGIYFNPGILWSIRHWDYDPTPRSLGPQLYIGGSNWVSAATRYVDQWVSGTHSGTNYNVHLVGYQDTVGLQPDGTLWVSEKSDPKTWTGNKLTRFGDETNWQQLARSYEYFSILLLKKDGTLWRLGTNQFDWRDWPQKWPGLRAFEPYQIGTNSDWAEISSRGARLAQKTDGSVWSVWAEKGKDKLTRMTNFDHIPLQTLSWAGDSLGAYVCPDGTLWTINELPGHGYYLPEFETFQSGKETHWVSVGRTWGWMVVLKSDGTLWQWNRDYRLPADAFTAPPNRLGIHNDWVAIGSTWSGIVSLAADGSLWFWPDRREYEYYATLLKLPKQPQFLGNIFGRAD